ncbi:MAG TPA: hypothetical protein VK631_11970 [Solirubrobacteraceae bacterium]|nr:hypothetical protein [Solirubrobacteraceae bacterium]
MTEVGHVHDWGSKRFVDHCHWVGIEKTCKGCGEVREDASERDFDLNPLQIAFARRDCARCRALTKGKEPASWRSLAT